MGHYAFIFALILGTSAPLFAEPPVHIRWMIRRDMPAVLDIENGSFDMPWVEEEFIRNLRQRNVIGMVAERGDEVVGYMIYELHKGKLRMLNFAVSPEQRKTGVGSAMVEKLKSKLSGERRDKIDLEMREHGTGAREFFAGHGFRRLPDGSWRYSVRELSSPQAVEELGNGTLYERLDVPEDANLEELKEAHLASRALAGKNQEARAMIDQAYAVLKDAKRRRIYDELPREKRDIPDSVMETYPSSRALRVSTPKLSAENFYQRFGLPENVEQSVIMDRYITLGKKFANSPDDVKRLNEAYAAIGNPAVRAAYDRRLTRAASPEDAVMRELVRKANPHHPDLYARTGIPFKLLPDLVPEYLDAALLEHAADPDAVEFLVEAGKTLNSAKARAAYDVRRIGERALQEALYEAPVGQSVFDFLAQSYKGIE